MFEQEPREPYDILLEGEEHDITTIRGFCVAISLVLSLQAGGLLHEVVPISTGLVLCCRQGPYYTLAYLAAAIPGPRHHDTRGLLLSHRGTLAWLGSGITT